MVSISIEFFPEGMAILFANRSLLQNPSWCTCILWTMVPSAFHMITDSPLPWEMRYPGLSSSTPSHTIGVLWACQVLVGRKTCTINFNYLIGIQSISHETLHLNSKWLWLHSLTRWLEYVDILGSFWLSLMQWLVHLDCAEYGQDLVVLELPFLFLLLNWMQTTVECNKSRIWNKK